jgi:hypothetical protein
LRRHAQPIDLNSSTNIVISISVSFIDIFAFKDLVFLLDYQFLTDLFINFLYYPLNVHGFRVMIFLSFLILVILISSFFFKSWPN